MMGSPVTSSKATFSERITLPLKLGSFEDLRYTHELADVTCLPRPASSQFTEFTPLLWVEGRSLATGAGVWVPFEMVHTNYTLPLPSMNFNYGFTDNLHLRLAVAETIARPNLNQFAPTQTDNSREPASNVAEGVGQ